MKERTFYTINLDLRRIIVMVVILIGMLSYFFILGNTMGKKSVTNKESNSSKELNEQPATDKHPEKSPLKPSAEENMVPAPAEGEPKDSEIVDLKPSTPTTETAKPIPVPVSPVLEVKDDLSKTAPSVPTANQPNANTVTAPTVPLKKPVYPYPVKKPVPVPVKAPLVLEEKVFYTIQLGAFSSQEQANKFKDNVMAKNKFPGKYVPYVLKQRDFFVVRVGKSTVKEELEKIVQNLDATTQASAMIVKNNKAL